MFDQDILRLLFGKDVKDVDVDVDMIVKKRNELIADRGKKARAFLHDTIPEFRVALFTYGCDFHTSLVQFLPANRYENIQRFLVPLPSIRM